MSLFKDTKVMGTTLMVLAVALIIAAVFSIIAAFGDDVEDDVKLAGICSAIGGVICAVIYFGFGSKVRNGEAGNGIALLAAFVKVIAIVTIVQAVFSIPYWADLVVGIIIGAVIFWCYTKIADGQATTADKVIWIVLMVLFVLSIIMSIISILIPTIPTILSGICGILIYGFMIALLLDPEVKSGMGM